MYISKKIIIFIVNFTECIFPDCARWPHRHPPTCIYPPSVGRIYPIPTYIINLQVFSNSLHNISSTNVYITKCLFPAPCAQYGIVFLLIFSYLTYGFPYNKLPIFGVPTNIFPIFGVPTNFVPIFGVPTNSCPIFGFLTFILPMFGVPTFIFPIFGLPTFICPIFGLPIFGPSYIWASYLWASYECGPMFGPSYFWGSL